VNVTTLSLLLWRSPDTGDHHQGNRSLLPIRDGLGRAAYELAYIPTHSVWPGFHSPACWPACCRTAEWHDRGQAGHSSLIATIGTQYLWRGGHDNQPMARVVDMVEVKDTFFTRYLNRQTLWENPNGVYLGPYPGPDRMVLP